ncbi:hypothetical protein HDU87_000769 [Geranomyces variabilis]|uniref:Uncharacterized protein n=1 Tax=Geranomyces variabilis TaxID=109894 RepID=A0AAD5TQF3_9FUNG|nr:hypothetical protein HDU87_000769 [Geranomyces variabilis]
MSSSGSQTTAGPSSSSSLAAMPSPRSSPTNTTNSTSSDSVSGSGSGNDTSVPLVNITITVPDSSAIANASQQTSGGDATAPNTSPIDPKTYTPPPINPSADPIQPNKGALVLQTYGDVQLSNTNSALFGALTVIGIVVLFSAWKAYLRRRKPIYLLNGLQATFLFIKTLSATFYAVMVSGSLNCKARSPMMNIPMVLAWDLIYGIMLIKLLLFTEWKRTVMVVVPLGAIAHFAIVTAGIVMRTSGVSSLGLCTDTYPLLFKHQYDVELILEVFLTGILLHGLASKKSGVFAGTKEVFRQLQFNEHTRVFLVVIFVTLKIIFSYGHYDVPTALTHGFDSARSAVVSWAITRGVRSSKSESPAALTTGLPSPHRRGQSFKVPTSDAPRKQSLMAKIKRSTRSEDDDDDGGLSPDDSGEDFDDIPGFNFSGDVKHRVASADDSKDTVAGRSAGDLV